MEKNLKINISNPVALFGVNDVNIERIINYFPKLKIVARGHNIKILGNDAEILDFQEKIKLLIEFHNKYNKLTVSDIEDILNQTITETEIYNQSDNILLYSTNGKPIKSKTPSQQIVIQKYNESDLLFAIGPAGTGKTYIAIALAVRALKNKQVKRIILSRPAVEAGEKLGFLPGDIKEKLDPYMQALYDALYEMIPGKKLDDYIENRTIQIAPLAYMRGRTLNNAIVILDEAQNTTINQLKMFLTRMGENSKFIVTGDITQIDIPNKSNSGLIHAKKKLSNIDGITFVEFNVNDVVRHPIVKQIIKHYDK